MESADHIGVLVITVTIPSGPGPELDNIRVIISWIIITSIIRFNCFLAQLSGVTLSIHFRYLHIIVTNIFIHEAK